MDGIRFGPSGNSDSFYAEGYKSTAQAPAWLHARGLTAFEYSFGRGITLSRESAEQIGAEAKKHGIALSVHAPYYINLSNPDPEKREHSLRYILDSAAMAAFMGADRVVVHPGALMKLERSEAARRCMGGLSEALRRLEGAGLSAVRLCPETMGRPGQIGDFEETLAFCAADERLIPCVDFAHVHALGRGCLNSTEDFTRLLDKMEQALGLARAKTMHIHFSTIEYSAAGERRHRTFADAGFGPRFEHLAPLLKARGYAPRVICECRGTMAEDAAAMARIYREVS